MTRKYYRHLTKIFIIFVFLVLIFPIRADAYLDPGTGSFIIQIIVGVLIGASAAVRIYWRKIKIFCSTYFLRKEKIENNEERDAKSKDNKISGINK